MPNPAHDAETRDLALLSLDSGRFESLSGLSQLFILQEILHTYESDHDLGEDTVKAYEVFDLIVGTGSGGLVACLLGPLRMSISEAIEAYLRIHTTVFASERQIVSIEENTRRLRDALQALIDARLSPTEQESAFSNFDNLVPRCMVVVTALSKAHVEYPTAFRSFRGRRANPPPCSLLEAVLSTLAHPHHFSEVTLKKGSIPLSFIAADLGHCNPLESLVAEVQDRFKNRSIALIVSIGTGSPNPINLEGADDFARAASEQATRCHSISERFEKMLHGHPGAYVRLDADGYDASTILSSSNVMAHVMGYLRQAKIVSKLDMVAEGMNERHGQIKVSEISFPKVHKPPEPAHIPTLDSDKYKIYGRGEIILVKRIGEGSGIESWEAKDKSNNNNLVTVHRFSDREKMGDLMKLQQGWGQYAHLLGYSNGGSPFCVIKPSQSLQTIKSNFGQSSHRIRIWGILQLLNGISQLPGGLTVSPNATIRSVLSLPCFREEDAELEMDVMLLISSGIVTVDGMKLKRKERLEELLKSVRPNEYEPGSIQFSSDLRQAIDSIGLIYNLDMKEFDDKLLKFEHEEEKRRVIYQRLQGNVRRPL